MEQEVLQPVETSEKVYQEYPMVALRGLVVFPHMNLNFDVSRKMSILAVEEAMANGQLLFLAKQKYVSTEEPGFEDIDGVGTLVRIRQISKLPNKNLRVLVEGEERAYLHGAVMAGGYLRAQVEACEDEGEDDLEEPMRGYASSVRDTSGRVSAFLSKGRKRTWGVSGKGRAGRACRRFY